MSFTASNFQSPGLIFTLFTYILFTLISGFCNLLLIETMQSIPGNKYFQGDIEFATLINFFFGSWAHRIGQFVLYGALQSNSIQCLVLTAQATDSFIITLFGKTCGLSMDLKWVCVDQSDLSSASPFGATMMIFTLGILVALFLSIPFFFYDLDQSVTLTVGAAFLAVVAAMIWVSVSVETGLDYSRTPLATPFGITYAQTMGIVMLNLGCATVVPSWINSES